MPMKICEQSIIDLVTRVINRPDERLALIGARYQTVRELQWPVIRRHVAQLSLGMTHQVIDNSEMSATFTNGSKLRCFSADRLRQMRGLFSTDMVTLEEITESEMTNLIEAGIIPPRYVPPPSIQTMICPPAAHQEPDEV